MCIVMYGACAIIYVRGRNTIHNLNKVQLIYHFINAHFAHHINFSLILNLMTEMDRIIKAMLLSVNEVICGKELDYSCNSLSISGSASGCM